MKSLPPIDRLRHFFAYNEETGQFLWRVDWRARKAGQIAGTLNRQGYVQLHLDQKKYQAHRVAWLLTTGLEPPDQIDHINGDRGDNRFTNLREADCSKNQANARRSSKNRSGFKGVHLNSNGLITASIRVGGKARYLGKFQSVEEAHEAYCVAAQDAFGEFARAV